MVKRKDPAEQQPADHDVAAQVTSAQKKKRVTRATTKVSKVADVTAAVTSNAAVATQDARPTAKIEILDWDAVAVEMERQQGQSASGVDTEPQATAGNEGVPPSDTSNNTNTAEATRPRVTLEILDKADWSLELDLTGLGAAEQPANAQSASSASSEAGDVADASEQDVQSAKQATSSVARQEQVNQLAQQRVRQLLGRNVTIQARALGKSRPVSGGSGSTSDASSAGLVDSALNAAQTRSADLRDLGRRAALAAVEDEKQTDALGNYAIDRDGELSEQSYLVSVNQPQVVSMSFIPRQRGLEAKTLPVERKVGAEVFGANTDPEAWGMEVPQESNIFTRRKSELASQELDDQPWNAHADAALQDEVHTLLQPAQYGYPKVTPSQQQQRCAAWSEYLAPRAAQARVELARAMHCSDEEIEQARQGRLYTIIPWTQAIDENDAKLGLRPVAQLLEELGLPVNPQAPRLRYREMIRLQEAHLEFTFQAYNNFRKVWYAAHPQPQRYGENLHGGIATESFSAYHRALQQLQNEIILEYWKLVSNMLREHQATHQQLVANRWFLHQRPILITEVEQLLAEAGGMAPGTYITRERAQELLQSHHDLELFLAEDLSRGLTTLVEYRAPVKFPERDFTVEQGWHELARNHIEYGIKVIPRFSYSMPQYFKHEWDGEIYYTFRNARHELSQSRPSWGNYLPATRSDLDAWVGLPTQHGLRSFSYLLATDVLAQGWRQLASLNQLPQALQCAPAFKLVIDPSQLPQLRWSVTHPQHWLRQLHASDAQTRASGVGVDLARINGAVYGRASLNFSPFRGADKELAHSRDAAYLAQAVQNATSDVVFATRKWLAALQREQLQLRQEQLLNLMQQLDVVQKHGSRAGVQGVVRTVDVAAVADSAKVQESTASRAWNEVAEFAASLEVAPAVAPRAVVYAEQAQEVNTPRGAQVSLAQDATTSVTPADLPNLRFGLGMHEVRTQAVAEYQANQELLADLELDVADAWQAPGATLADLRSRKAHGTGKPVSGVLQRVLAQRGLVVPTHATHVHAGDAQSLADGLGAREVVDSVGRQLPATSVQTLAPYLIGMESWYQEVVSCKPLSEFLTISTNLSMLEIHTHFTENIPQQVGREMTVIQAQDKGLFFSIDDPSKLAPSSDNMPSLDPELQQLLFAPRVIRVRGQQFYDDVLWCNSRHRMYPVNINRAFFKTLSNSVDLHQLEMSFQTLHYMQGKAAQVAMTQVRAREKCYTMYGPRYMAVSRYHAAIRYIQYKVTTDPNSKYKLGDNHPRINQISERELRVGMKFADAVYKAAGHIDAALVQQLLADQEPISDDLAADIAFGIKYEFERHVLCSIDVDFTKVVNQARYTSAVLLAQYQASERANHRAETNVQQDFIAVPVPERMVATQDRYRVPRSLSLRQQQELPWSYRLLFRLAMSSGYFDQHREVDYYLENRRDINHLMRTAVPAVQVFQRLQPRNVWQIPSVIMRYVQARSAARYQNIQLLESRFVPKELTRTGGDVMERQRDRLELILPNPMRQRVFVPNLQTIMPIPLLSYHLLVCRDQVASFGAYKDHLLYTYYHHLRPWYKFTAK